MSEKNLRGFSDAAAHCRTSAGNFRKLASGEMPRFDALQRICRGLGIHPDQLIVGVHKAKSDPAEVVELTKKAL